jgi:DNA polymerase III delta subunit
MLKDYRKALSNYSAMQLRQAIHLIHLADLQVKGIEQGGDNDAEILKELIFRIML